LLADEAHKESVSVSQQRCYEALDAVEALSAAAAAAAAVMGV